MTRESDRVKADLGNPRDWNMEYQKIIESPSDTVEDKLKRYQAIASLTQDFEYTGNRQKVLSDTCHRTTFLTFSFYNSTNVRSNYHHRSVLEEQIQNNKTVRRSGRKCRR